MLSDRARVAGPKRGMRPVRQKKRARPDATAQRGSRNSTLGVRREAGSRRIGWFTRVCMYREKRRRNAANASTCIAESRGVQVYRVANHSRQPTNNLLVFHVRFDSLSFRYLYLPGLLRISGISGILWQGCGCVTSRGWRVKKKNEKTVYVHIGKHVTPRNRVRPMVRWCFRARTWTRDWGCFFAGGGARCLSLVFGQLGEVSLEGRLAVKMNLGVGVGVLWGC